MSRVLLIVFLTAFIILRFYQLDERMPFGWDQIQNSWVMKNMIIDQKLPLEGMVAKGNSGIYIGPAYYYLLAPFYYLFNLDPIASGVFAGVIAVINFLILYVVTTRIFNEKTALLALFFYTFSDSAITSDRVPWPVIFIPFVSVLIFYNLYKVTTGKTKNIFWLALFTGFAFNVHFTAIFFPIIILCSVPLMLKSKRFILYGILSIPLFALWFLPTIFVGRQNGFSSLTNLEKYLSIYYHGFHLVRFWQLARDAFIQFTTILYLNILKPITLLILPLFMFLI